MPAENLYMSAVQSALTYGVFGLNILWLIGLLLYTAYRAPIQTEFLDTKLIKIKDLLTQYYREISFALVTVATSGSLYFSQILNWEPCLLCWYQRILMYPLAVLFGVAVLLEKDDVSDYALPLIGIGSGISFYHYMMQMLDSIQSTCTTGGTSCDAIFTQGLDYITIPMMAFTVFLTVLVLNWKFKE